MRVKMEDLKDLEDYYNLNFADYPFKFNELNRSQLKTLKNSLGFSGWRMRLAMDRLKDALIKTETVRFIRRLIKEYEN